MPFSPDVRRRLQNGAIGAVCGAMAAMTLANLWLFEIVSGANPTYWVVGGAFVGAALLAAFARLVPITLTACVLLLVGYFVIAYSSLTVGPAERWIRDDSIPASAKPLDAVVVLSAGVTPDSVLGEEALDRLIAGGALVQEGVAPRLITTRTFADPSIRWISSDTDTHRIVSLLGIESKWLVVDSVRTTHDEATQVRALLGAERTPRIAVVTSPLHTRRACAVFEGAGFTVYCVAARIRNYAPRHPNDPHDRFRLFGDYVYERLGMMKYRAHGWVK